MKIVIKKIVFVFFILMIFSCDTGLGLIETKISGNVIFVNSDKKPDKVESVWVLAASKSLFENPTLNDLIISDRPINLSKDTSNYEVFVPVGSYSIIAAIWKEKNKDWDYLNILGLYGFDPVTGTLYDTEATVISEDKKVVSNKNIICDWKFLSLNQNTIRKPKDIFQELLH